ncbi:sensor domain-containing diguanylate cyclase [Luteimonas arsenica]|uniref:sensor domain-containing diguanylate cyclase n=1 Tax=Luteimonas arsenica TaxID=1586242 RepID=UPI0014043417|nr:sensor domain-containing diguanylate cyclase [Luteimonas arsenica]
MQLTDQAEVRERELRFVARVHHMRTLGAALSALLVASVLHGNGAPAWAWALWAFNGFAWPVLANRLTLRSPEPVQAAHRYLMMDSAAAGAWIAIMQFNLVPSAVLLAMVTMDKVAVGGWRFLGRAAPALLLACGGVWLLQGFPVSLESSLPQILATLPFLFAYPVALAATTYGLGRSIAERNRQLQCLNRIDALTGLANRRGWNEAMVAELARHARTRRPAVLMLVDVDNLKDVNDTSGHLVGDEVLRCVASVLSSCTREIDTPARYGGDEFGVLLAETNLRGGMRVAERVRTAFLEQRPAEAARGDCTLSIGLAEADLSVVNAEEWLKRADAAMYRAKAAGRNRVEPATVAFGGVR